RFCVYHFGQQSAFVERTFYRYSGVSKGACPFRWNSKNQEVFGVLFVKLSSHKKVSAGVGRVGPQCGSQEPSCKNLAGLLSPRPRFLSSRKERNQRFAKEEVSSLDSPL